MPKRLQCSFSALSLLILVACGPKLTLEQRIPITVTSGTLTWTRGPAQPLALGGLNPNFKEGFSFIYSGMGGINVHAIEMKSRPSAFDALQSWRTTPGMLPAQKGNLFFVFSFEQPDTGQKFIAAFLEQVKTGAS